jgi:hypothetical protein
VLSAAKHYLKSIYRREKAEVSAETAEDESRNLKLDPLLRIRVKFVGVIPAQVAREVELRQ